MQYKYETPKILRSIFSTDSCLQSDNGVSTPNTTYLVPNPQPTQPYMYKMSNKKSSEPSTTIHIYIIYLTLSLIHI